MEERNKFIEKEIRETLRNLYLILFIEFIIFSIYLYLYSNIIIIIISY